MWALLDIPVLHAGTYYLTFYSAGSTGDLAGAAFPQPAQIVDPTFTLNSEYDFEGPLSGCCASPLPADPLALTPNVGLPTNLLAFSLTGNVGISSAAPEPLPNNLVGAALGGMLVLRGLLKRTRV